LYLCVGVKELEGAQVFGKLSSRGEWSF